MNLCETIDHRGQLLEIASNTDIIYNRFFRAMQAYTGRLNVCNNQGDSWIMTDVIGCSK